ncbi:hypothetical protein [Streptomyces sp. NPDC020298]|uniref:hypothetical protein n=1 Tax=unclassified Streptomyces TaxID=2593676 RepID=UPI003400BAF3
MSARDTDRALAYPEPPASLYWHRHGAKARPLTPAQQRRNRELLDIAQRGHRRIHAATTAERTS